MKFRVAAFAVLTATATGCYAAQPGDFYIGINAGQTRLSNACQSVSQDVQSLGYTMSSFNCTNTARAIGGLIGYQFDSHLGAELSYMDFGKPHANATINGVPVSAYAYPTAYEFALVWTQPVAQHFSVLGRLGLGITTLKDSASALGLTSSASAQSRTGVPGIGFQYDIGKIAARLMFDYYGKVGDASTTGTTNLSSLTMGLTYSF